MSIGCCLCIAEDPPAGSVMKNLPATQETQVRSLGQEDLLEKEMATLSSILAWEIPWTEEPGGLQSIVAESDSTEETAPTFLSMDRLVCFTICVVSGS